MADFKLIRTADLTEDPEFNGSESEVGSAAQNCPLSQTEVKTIKEVYFTTMEGQRIDRITEHDRVKMVVNTANMSGEQLAIPMLQFEGHLAVDGELIEEDHIIRLEIRGDSEELELEVIPVPLRLGPDPDVVFDIETPRLRTVEFLEGDDQTVAQGEVLQFVNLPREERFVDQDLVKSIDRLSDRPRVRVTFDRPGRHSFRALLIPDSENLEYTESEEGNNGKFRYEERERTYETDPNGIAIVSDLFLDTIGGNKFRVQVRTDAGDRELSSSVTVKKLIHVVEVKMRGLNSITSTLSPMTEEYARNHIELIYHPSVEVSHYQNIDVMSSDSDRFVAEVVAQFQSSEAAPFAPHAIAASYTDHLAYQPVNVEIAQENIRVGPSSSTLNIRLAVGTPGEPEIKPRTLWRNMIDGEDWFIRCRYWPRGAEISDWITIRKEKCTPVNRSYNAHISSQIEVDLTGLPDGVGTVSLEVRVATGWAAGISLNDHNIICATARSAWSDTTVSEQNNILIHELGHQIGMASNGSSRLPDRVETFYTNDQGHYGPHCFHGIPDGQEKYNSREDRESSDCVMYGMLNGMLNFCEHCTIAAKKTDLSVGF